MTFAITDEMFEALNRSRQAQRQPHEKDIRVCSDCSDCTRVRTHAAVGELTVNSSASLILQVVEADGDTYRVISSIDGSWSEGTRSGGLRGGGSYFVHRPTLREDGSLEAHQWTEDGVSASFAETLSEAGLIAAEQCTGLNDYGMCPAALAIAQRMQQALLEHPRFFSEPKSPDA